MKKVIHANMNKINKFLSSSSMRMVYLFLVKNQKNEELLTPTSIASELGYKQSNVSRTLNLLDLVGFIRTKKKVGKNVIYLPNLKVIPDIILMYHYQLFLGERPLTREIKNSIFSKYNKYIKMKNLLCNKIWINHTLISINCKEKDYFEMLGEYEDSLLESDDLEIRYLYMWLLEELINKDFFRNYLIRFVKREIESIFIYVDLLEILSPLNLFLEEIDLDCLEYNLLERTLHLNGIKVNERLKKHYNSLKELEKELSKFKDVSGTTKKLVEYIYSKKENSWNYNDYICLEYLKDEEIEALHYWLLIRSLILTVGRDYKTDSLFPYYLYKVSKKRALSSPK